MWLQTKAQVCKTYTYDFVYKQMTVLTEDPLLFGLIVYNFYVSGDVEVNYYFSKKSGYICLQNNKT